ncbi:MAG: hypothetical protein II540_02205 [Paludibacteraceae bacterium]|nr:hypothetical protein [Paludibacteraceae bacterium]
MKTIKYLSYIALSACVLLVTSCEPDALKEEDVLVNADNVSEIIADGSLININTLLNTYMTEEGNFKSDSCLYRTRSTYGSLQLFSLDTLPTDGPGIYIRGRIATDDYGGNFYKSIVIQQVNDWENNDATIEQQCLRVSIDMGSASGLYHQGQELIIRCNGLAIGRYANQPQLCIPTYNNNIYANSATEKVGWVPGRIPSERFRNVAHLIGAPDKSKLVYETMTLTQMYSKYLSQYKDVVGARLLDGRLVKLTDVHFSGEYDNNGEVASCSRYKADGTDTGNPEMDENACTFGPTTKNVGYPQSRYVVDKASSEVIKSSKSVPATNAVLVSTSEYARYAYYYLPADKYIGSITGILGYYMDNGGHAPDGGEWSITPCNMSEILPECQAADADPRWIPAEWKLGTPQED